ncbi:MAG TPA: cupin domain-containing protein [Planctomycetota bacterium]|nr:cupin domain-containing protein [Planctomycetota bacterium]
METRTGKNFSAVDAGAWRDLAQHVYGHPKGGSFRGKLFLKELLGMTSMEVSLGRLPPGAGLPFLHRHQEHEEVYIFVGGRGQFQVDGEILEVHEGTVVRVAPDGARSWRNNSTGDLYYICVQATQGTMKGDTTRDGVGVDRPMTWPT